MITIKILSVDQSRNGAFSIFDYERGTLLFYGAFSHPRRQYSYAQAVLDIEKLVDRLIRENGISAVFIEGIHLGRNVQSFCALAQLQGVLINLFEKNAYRYAVVPSAAWKARCAAVLGQAIPEGAAASKRMALDFVRKTFRIQTQNDNLADAVCIGWYVCSHIIIEENTIYVKE